MLFLSGWNGHISTLQFRRIDTGGLSTYLVSFPCYSMITIIIITCGCVCIHERFQTATDQRDGKTDRKRDRRIEWERCRDEELDRGFWCEYSPVQIQEGSFSWDVAGLPRFNGLFSLMLRAVVIDFKSFDLIRLSGYDNGDAFDVLQSMNADWMTVTMSRNE